MGIPVVVVAALRTPSLDRVLITCGYKHRIGSSIDSYALLKQFPPDLNLRDSQTVGDDGDSVH